MSFLNIIYLYYIYTDIISNYSVLWCTHFYLWCSYRRYTAKLSAEKKNIKVGTCTQLSGVYLWFTSLPSLILCSMNEWKLEQLKIRTDLCPLCKKWLIYEFIKLKFTSFMGFFGIFPIKYWKWFYHYAPF